MAIGIMFSGIISGLSLAIWALFQGYSVLMAAALYPLAGILGALVFILVAVLRPEPATPCIQQQEQ